MTIRETSAGKVEGDRHRLLHGIKHSEVRRGETADVHDEQHDERGRHPFADSHETVGCEQPLESDRHAQEHGAGPRSLGTAVLRRPLAKPVVLQDHHSEREHDA